jgi:secreted protein with Ig-like and vWFA domain
VRVELNTRDDAIANLESELGSVKQENKDQVSTIAKLQTELAAGENKQLPTPDRIKPVLGGTSDRLTVGTPELVEYINSIDPESGIIAKTIGNAINRKNNGKGDGNGKNMERSLSSLEETYNFKYLGKVGKNHQFSIPNL